MNLILSNSKICGFHVSHFTFRGTETATHDYAYYNQSILKNKSIIFTPKEHTLPPNKDILEKFQKFLFIYILILLI